MPKPRVIGKLVPGQGYNHNTNQFGFIYRTWCIKCFAAERRWGYFRKNTIAYSIREGQLGPFQAKCYMCKVVFCNGSSNLPPLFEDENGYPMVNLPNVQTMRRRGRRTRS